MSWIAATDTRIMNEYNAPAIIKYAPVPWFTERVCVQLKINNASGIIKETHGNTAVVEMEDKSTHSLNYRDVSLIRPQRHDIALVTTGRYVGKEGELISINGAKAMLKENAKSFVTVDFGTLAKIRPVVNVNMTTSVAHNGTNHPSLVIGHTVDVKRKMIANVNSTTGFEQDPPEKKKGRLERTCFICKVSKSLHDNFSKSQRGKGDTAKCKECVGAQQGKKQEKSDYTKSDRVGTHEEQLKRAADKREARRKKQEEETANRMAKRKKQEEERKRKAEIQAAELKHQEEERKRQEAEERMKIVTENEEKEAQNYNQKKEEYERHVQKLKDDGKDIEKEMATPSDLVYVVTSISKREGQFSPHLHGIYTTCKKAQECARKVFEKASESYRDGTFVPNEKRTAKCDTTDFLLPGVAFTSRVMFELFGRTSRVMMGWGKDEYVYDCTAIGINAIPIDTNVVKDLPFLRIGTHAHEPPGERKKEDANTTLVGGSTELYAIFSHEPGDSDHTHPGDDSDVHLCGVFTNKENAINSGLTLRKKILKVQKKNDPRVCNGMSFYQMLHDNCWAVTIETVALDLDHGGDNNGKELDFGTKDCTWENPDIEWYNSRDVHCGGKNIEMQYWRGHLQIPR
mmetsp:Transcript_41352/g.75640  ORF Transcript_41352/g.75640 Transcript_41352/m.75640 type:complete len:628 (-) Transcript_41352:43-1926(-)